MNAHTKGEWVAFSNSLGVGVTGAVADIAHCHGLDTLRSREEVEANARLIAAAPAMLAALKDIKDFLRQSGYDTRLVREVIVAAEPTP